MWHGDGSRLYPGSVVCLTEVQHEQYADELAEVLNYNVAKKKWALRLCHPRFDGRQILVAETGFNLSYCILPLHATPKNARKHVNFSAERAGCMGRGLLIEEPCAQGRAIFEEQPFFLSATGVEAQWLARWNAYVRMYERANCDEAMNIAFNAFECLSDGEPLPAAVHEVEAAAETVARAGGYHESLKDATEIREVETRIKDVLLKVKANQFEFQDGTRFEASALYHLAAMMNHSCAPTVVLEPQWSELDSGCMSESDGWIVVRAARDLQPGEEMCLNYGPDELLGWPVRKRQEYIKRQQSFCCRCQRCLQEQADELKPTSPSLGTGELNADLLLGTPLSDVLSSMD
eukprot:TRINITY_DN62601_c0_g1_i1.p1 TRINITY_DN62601_c0_g1~~TRINITY_DN62601_c0_g1_i1.p1  ORF type:complete len:347 (+),score=45.17 TRINITY_DN62601_c0_g1_i1:85-1125(+)